MNECILQEACLTWLQLQHICTITNMAGAIMFTFMTSPQQMSDCCDSVTTQSWHLKMHVINIVEKVSVSFTIDYLKSLWGNSCRCSCWRVKRSHKCKFFSKITGIRLILDHWLKWGWDFLSCQSFPVQALSKGICNDNYCAPDYSQFALLERKDDFWFR